MIEDDVENSYRWVIDCLSTFIVLVRFRLSVTIVGEKKKKERKEKEEKNQLRCSKKLATIQWQTITAL